MLAFWAVTPFWFCDSNISEKHTYYLHLGPSPHDDKTQKTNIDFFTVMKTWNVSLYI
jgi:hypothetical protein